MKKIKEYTTTILILCLLSFFSYSFVLAHEVYVLEKEEINQALNLPPLNFWQVIKANKQEFIFWTLLTITIVVLAFLISAFRPLERKLYPFFKKIKRYAPIVGQITLGSSLLASGLYGAIFGVEIPLKIFLPIWIGKIFLIFLGLGIIAGIFVRTFSLITIFVFFALILRYGIYMANYFTYLAEAVVLLLFGPAYKLTSESKILNLKRKNIFSLIEKKYKKFKFLIIRVGLGISLIYASIYAKYLHGYLALETIKKYQLTKIFPFDPLFLVLGAFAIEILLGIFFIFGIELRFASLFFLVFLALSIWYFGEAVWPHLILIGTVIAIFLEGYDDFTLEKRLFKKDKYEPVL